MTWVEVSMDGVTRRWDYTYGPPAKLRMRDSVENCPTLVLTCGDMTRTAMMSDEVALDDYRVKLVAANMACWDDEARFVPAVRLYVWGLLSYADGTTGTGLCLLVVDLDGTVSGMFPIESSEIS
jgi:hypothetical protein